MTAAPHARTRRAVTAEATAVVAELPTMNLRVGRPFVGTWQDVPGDTFDLHADRHPDGERFVVHTWHTTGETTVRHIWGSFWRARPGREGINYGNRTVPADTPNRAAAIADAIRELRKDTPS